MPNSPSADGFVPRPPENTYVDFVSASDLGLTYRRDEYVPPLAPLNRKRATPKATPKAAPKSKSLAATAPARPPDARPPDGPGVLADAFRGLSSLPAWRMHADAIGQQPAAFGGSESRMRLAALGMEPRYREVFDRLADAYWLTRDAVPASSTSSPLPEVVIGAGLHAAIYCSVRVRARGEAPVVLEAGPSAGGIFAISREPSFRLNSENVPGITGVPARRGALNYLPACPVQPADLSADEFQSNVAMAFCIRVALALNARVGTNYRVVRAEYLTNGVWQLTDGIGQYIYTKRVIDARGLGEAPQSKDPAILNFRQFMASLDAPWPFAGARRWAVIGNGDSAMCSIEALLGIGPSRSPATGGYVSEVIDWYAPDKPADREAWRNSQRGRYTRIGSYLARPDRPARVRVIDEPGQAIGTGEGVLVNGRAYDRVVAAVGWKLDNLAGYGAEKREAYSLGGNVLATKCGPEFYRVGPAAQLEFTPTEVADGVNLVRRGSNKDAIFRLGHRTAALAANLA